MESRDHTQLKIIAAIRESTVVELILTRLRLQARAPPRTPARERQVAHAPDRCSTVSVPSAQQLGTMGPAAPGAF